MTMKLEHRADPSDELVLPHQCAGNESLRSKSALLSGICARRTYVVAQALLTAVVLSLLLQGCSRKPAAPPDGAALFARKCAGCHRPSGNDSRAPEPEALHQMSKAYI
ncbi:MAG: c-type cytochrome, partial [Terriglobales bacterium]